MDNLLLLSLLYAGLPLLIYIAIGTFIYSRGEVYRIYSLIFFISVPTLILVVSIFHFTITYFTGGYTSKEKPGYFIYKILFFPKFLTKKFFFEIFLKNFLKFF